MKITQDEVVDNQTTLHIELEDDDLSPYLDRGYQRIVQQIVIPGFRKGKAPRRVVEGFVGRESLLNEVLDNMVFEVIGKAIEQQELDSVGIPRVNDLELDPVHFTAIVPLRPDIHLGDYEAIRIDYDEPDIGEEDVTARIDAIRESLGTWEPVERAAQIGDLTTIDLGSDVDGDSPWQGEDLQFYMADDGRYPVPGFSDHLVDLEPGHQAEFTLEIPEDYSDASIAGKEASFTVNVKSVRERALPDMDDEFAQGLPDGYADLAALRTAVEESLKADTEARSVSDFRNSAIEALIEGTEMTIPKVIVEGEAEHLQEDQVRYLQNANIRMSDFLTSIGKTEEDIQQEAYTEAEQRVRRNLVMTKLVDVEGVEVTDQELDERFNTHYAGQRMRRQERRDRRNSLVDMIKYEKAIDIMVAIAKGERESAADTQQTEPDDVQDSEGGTVEDDSKA